MSLFRGVEHVSSGLFCVVFVVFFFARVFFVFFVFLCVLSMFRVVCFLCVLVSLFVGMYG